MFAFLATSVLGMALKGGARAIAGNALANAKSDISAIPPKVKLALLAIAAAVLLYFVHQHQVGKLIATTKAAQKAADDAAWQKRLDQGRADAIAWRERATQQGAAIARLNKEKHDAEIRDHAALADALSMRGPGAAASHCGPDGHSSAAAVAGGRNEAAADAHAAGSQVPAGDWAVVPWSWLVDRAREHDDLLTDEATRRAADKQQREAWEQLRAGAK
jgi:hypothetical protein